MLTQFHEILDQAAQERADSPALTDGGGRLDYGELAESVLAAGSGLRELGVYGGARVAVWFEKQRETVIAILGASAAGGVFVPINPLLRPPQVAHILADCDVEVLVTTANRLDILAEELSRCPALRTVLVVGEGPSTVAPDLDRIDKRAWGEVMSSSLPARALSGRIDVDVAAIFYTSGSTGLPKGVVLSHRNLLVGAQSVNGYLHNRPDDRILAVLPISFDAGFSQISTGLHAGAEVVLHNHFLAKQVVKACAAHGITALTCVPPLWMQLVEQDWPIETAEAVRYFANTGGRMPRSTLDRLRALFPNAEPYLMYGLTEAFRSTYLDPAEVDRRPDSIGKAIPNAEVKAVRSDGGECDPGEVGELVHRGALVALGYWNDAERTAERFKQAPGAFEQVKVPETAVWSGDLVRRDEEGFLYFVGRDDEMIKTSGYRVSPSEIEEVAYGTGLVRDAVALGVEDERLGQRIVLVVSSADGSGDVDLTELTKAFKVQVPLYMVPKQLELRSEIPRSANGKFDRNALHEEVSEG